MRLSHLVLWLLAVLVLGFLAHLDAQSCLPWWLSKMGFWRWVLGYDCPVHP